LKRLIQFLKLYLLFLAAFEAIRLYFIFYHYKLFSESPFMVFLQTAFKGFRLDLSASAYCLMPIFLVVLLENIFRKKSNKWVLRSLLIFEFILIFAIGISDPELYAQWGNKFNNQVLVYISHPKEMALSAGSANWIKTMLFILVLLPLLYLLLSKLFKVLEKDIPFSWQYGLLTFLTLGFNFIVLRGGLGVATISQASAIYSSKQIYNTTAINSFWNALYYIVNDTRTLYGEEYIVLEQAEAKKLFDLQVKQTLGVLELSNQLRPNVLVVVLESFTALASQYYSGANNCTPYMDRLSEENLSFMRCYASGDRTEKGLLAINSGYPAQPVSSLIVFPDKVGVLPGLGKVLKGQGYQNTFVYGGDAEFASMKSYFLMQGFDKVIDKKDFDLASLKSKWGAHDAEMYSKTLESINVAKQPFYTMALSLSSHEPFEVPYAAKDLKKDDWYRFKNSILYADKSLGDFIANCKKQPWYANTLIVVVADHGHDIGHNISIDNVHFFGKEKYQIPLLVLGGALKEEFKGKKIKNVVSQTIIPSLILQSMHLPYGDFIWQTSALDSNGFAQYHYNNGFGRVSNHSEFVYDNNGMSSDFKGIKKEAVKIKNQGRIFQQVLIDDFLKK
jgi:phosphoglycerol transferase MdoB-like AlkP superfamily enzyme